jgi:fermentation-respiration switch protein FrsA (DUF1100 family)
MRFLQKFTFLFCFSLCSCNSVFFHPTKEAVINPEQLGIKYRAIEINDGDGPALYGWFMPANAEALGTILHLHGNAENISTHLASVYWLPSRSYNVLTIDYRGYGNSEGEASMHGVHADALRAVNYLRTQLPEANKPLILYGQSLGASIALYTASLPETKGLFKAVIAESPFSSYRGIAREKLELFWLTYILRYPLAATISSTYDPIKIIDKISPTPLLLVHAAEDEIVSLQNSQDLFDKAKEPKALWIINGSSHIQIFKDLQNRNKLIEFLKQST